MSLSSLSSTLKNGLTFELLEWKLITFFSIPGNPPIPDPMLLKGSHIVYSTGGLDKEWELVYASNEHINMDKNFKTKYEQNGAAWYISLS